LQCCCIFDHDQEALLKMNNPFALIALACQKSLLEGKIPEKQLGEERLSIAKALLSHNYDHDRIIVHKKMLAAMAERST